jgi:SAM-dependent methyltransferase
LHHVAAPVFTEPLRLDIGCGPNPTPGFVGCDTILFPNVTHQFHAGRDQWPFSDSSVDEARASHFLEHLTNFNGLWERVKFFNELYRVLKPGAGCALVFPHWCSNRYYGDPTHKEPFSEMGFYYLSREWRATQAPHADVQFNPDGYSCDFEATWGYNVHPQVQLRNQETQQHMLSFYKEAAQDVCATVKARK